MANCTPDSTQSQVLWENRTIGLSASWLGSRSGTQSKASGRRMDATSKHAATVCRRWDTTGTDGITGSPGAFAMERRLQPELWLDWPACSGSAFGHSSRPPVLAASTDVECT